MEDLDAPIGDSLERHFTLAIKQFSPGRDTKVTVGLWGPGLDKFAGEIVSVILNLDHILGLVNNCREVWHRYILKPKVAVEVVPGEYEYPYIFDRTWNHRSRGKEWLDAIGAKLARAGETLFQGIFYSQAQGALEPFGREIEQLARERELVAVFRSDACFVPWNMLYTHPDPNERLDVHGSNFKWEGFWGYKHIIQHEPDKYPREMIIRPDDNGYLRGSLNVDDKIDTTWDVKFIAEHIEQFRQLSDWKIVVRNKSTDFFQALREKPFPDQIMYFFAHAEVSGDPTNPTAATPRIMLGDKEPFGTDVIDNELGRRILESHPVVFINACQAGQMTSLFYRAFAAKFLEKGAIALIGPQIYIPGVFADEFGRRFIQKFLSKDNIDSRRIGVILRQLTRDFIDDYFNPLGLTYSLYRGIDCYVDWKEHSAP